MYEAFLLALERAGKNYFNLFCKNIIFYHFSNSGRCVSVVQKSMRMGNREGLINNSFKHSGLNPLKLYIMLKFKGLIPFKHSIEK